MKKILVVLLLLLVLVGCGQKEKNEGNEITELLSEGYDFAGTTFDDTEWRGLFVKDEKEYVLVKAKMNTETYEEIEEVFFEDDKYHEAVQKLEIIETVDVSDKLPGEEELQSYVGKTFGELEEEGFYNTGYCESDNFQYNFTYENDTICISVKSSPDTPIENMDDFSENDIRELVICEVVDCYLSSNILYIE